MNVSLHKYFSPARNKVTVCTVELVMSIELMNHLASEIKKDFPNKHIRDEDIEVVTFNADACNRNRASGAYVGKDVIAVEYKFKEDFSLTLDYLPDFYIWQK